MAIFYYGDVKTPLQLDIDNEVRIGVCIPCYNEDDIFDSLESLRACLKPPCSVAVIVLINDKVNDLGEVKKRNLETYEEIVNQKKRLDLDWLTYYPIYVKDLPIKKGGVGLARKLAMDSLANHYQKEGLDHGIICCFDADSLCSPNYFVEVENFFLTQKKRTACSIHFEHPFQEIEDNDKRRAIVEYELHLRYYINMQRLLKLPFAYQTIGSSMAVLANDYKALGGMNTKQAGEDFYFLQKFISVGRCADLSETIIFPSCRPSDRVPFGTGRAVNEILKSKEPYKTYNYHSFSNIKDFLDLLPEIYETEILNIQDLSIEKSVKSFFESCKLKEKVMELKKNTSNYSSFEKRFFQWFNAFALMKMLHYLRDNGYNDISIKEGVAYLFERLEISLSANMETNLKKLREFDKRNVYP